MDVSKYTEKAQEAISVAQKLPRREIILSSKTSTSSGSSRSEDGVVPQILEKLGVDYNQVKRQLENELEKLAKASGPDSGLPLTAPQTSVRCRGKRIAQFSKMSTLALSTC